MSCSMRIASWAKIVQSENISTPIYVECDKMYRSKVCVQEFSYFVSGLDIQVEKSEYYSPVRQKISCRWWNMRSHIPFFSSYSYYFIRTYGLVVKTGCRESGDVGSIPDDCWNPLQCLGHFAWHWARQCTDTCAFYIAALSIILFFQVLDFVSGDLALTEL